MFIYNLTVKVSLESETEWLQWVQEIHIPDVMTTGLFTEQNFYKLLDHDDEGGKIYVLQFVAEKKEDVDTYFNQYAQEIIKKNADRWNGKAVFFRTFLQNVQ